MNALSILVNNVTNVFSKVKTSCLINWPGSVNVLIWTTGFFFMLGLTIRDFTPLLNNYKNDNIATQMTIRTEPVLPNFTICLPYYSTYLFKILDILRTLDPEYLNGSKSMHGVCGRCEDMKKNKWDFWTHMDAKDINSTKAVIKYLVQSFSDHNLTKITLNENNFHWMQPLIDAVWYYFYWIYDSDLNVLISEDYSDLKDSGAWISHKALDWLPREKIDELFDYLPKVLELCVTSGGCTLKPSADDPPDNTTRLFKINKNNLTIVRDKFCFPAPTEFGIQDFVCSYNRWPWQWDRYLTSNFEIYPSPAILYSTVDDNDAIYSTSSSVSKNKNESEHVFLTYNIGSKLIAKKPKETSCSKEPYVEVCMAKGQVQAAIDYCQCIPFTFRYLQAVNASFPYCNSSLYTSCEGKIRKSLDKIRVKCNNKCEYTFYTWSPKPIVKYNEFNETTPQFKVSFGATKVPFIEFSSVKKNTAEQFLSQVGGLMNFYLGISGLTLFALLTFCIDQSKRWYRLRRNSLQSEHQENGQIDGWQFLRIVSIFHTLGRRSTDERPNRIERNQEDLAIRNGKEIEELKKKIANMDQALSDIQQQMHNIERF